MVADAARATLCDLLIPPPLFPCDRCGRECPVRYSDEPNDGEDPPHLCAECEAG